MELHPEDIAIAITVYSRRDYVCEAIRSALDQTIPVKVIVVEDCGPDPTLRDFVLKEFGDRITYYRNPKNRGLFDNWHACMEYCGTPWLSILHDDDMLRPNFVETMLQLSKAAPGRSLYFGRQVRLEGGITYPPPPIPWKGDWADLDLPALAEECFLYFPAQLFRVADARALGGFRTNSYFTGDWDMWFRLASKYGGVQSALDLAIMRGHDGVDRGTSVVVRKGWKWALDNCQRKRNLARLRLEKGVQIPFERTKLLKESPIPSRLLVKFSPQFSRRLLAYNAWLFTHSRAPHFSYAVLQWLVRLFGPNVLRMAAAVQGRKG